MVQVGLYCPKIAIMFEGWATDSKPAQFEVAAQELSAKFQSGVHTNRHSQTSPGPVSLQVSISHFLPYDHLVPQLVHLFTCRFSISCHIAVRPCWHLQVVLISTVERACGTCSTVVNGRGTPSRLTLLLKHEFHACISIAHWKAMLPASRQHKLQIAFKHG
jgi:hypothetical protein